MTTILMTYVSGTQKMLEVAIKALERHDAGSPWILSIVSDANDKQGIEEAKKFKDHADIKVYDVGVASSGSGQHGRLLDRAIQDVQTDYTLTMDSDCFPVADGWLSDLEHMLSEEKIIAAGLRWPWIPPIEEKVGKNTLEWRIRKFHNLNNLQPACQLLLTDQFRDNKWKFADPEGDDTNHGFMEKAHAAGFNISGWNVTRCALPDIQFDIEMNRHESLIYGDKIYHHVGATRECRGLSEGKTEIFQKARERVYNESGAEWMLASGNSYVFKMDREEEVVQGKMTMMYQSMREFLVTHGCLFSKDWA